MKHKEAQNDWEWEVNKHTGWWQWKIQELWAYRGLLIQLTRRDMLIRHQQTLLGPLWLLFQPCLTMLTYLLVFNKMIGISTGRTPPVLFYLMGIMLWTFFSESFLNVSNTFLQFGNIFKKVYFPRLIIPLSTLSSQLMRLLLQAGLFIVISIVYCMYSSTSVSPTPWLIVAPLAILMAGINGLSAGLLFALMTARYRDLVGVVHLGVRLMMFVTPVLYPISIVPARARWIAELNPLSAIFEFCRYAILGEGTFTSLQLLYSLLTTIGLFVAAMMSFSKQADKLVDVI